MDAACRLHPDAPSVGACPRCGGGVCPACLVDERGTAYHKDCYREMKLGVLTETPPPEPAAPEPAPEAVREPEEAEDPDAGSPFRSPFVLRVLRFVLGGLAGGFLGFAAASVVVALMDPLRTTGADAERVFYVCAALGLVCGMTAGVLVRSTRAVLALFALSFALSLLALPAARAISTRGAAEIEDDTF
ncbi:MAG: hypothetical protein K8I02_11980 [Candidatus Methylomirabilis sp.]|nr:hypothetical protein [Deltaproteobacteria bacterium]